jgi:diguanylate cyclase (GGDEF)-like protein/PAS domain S-box-containing protein
VYTGHQPQTLVEVRHPDDDVSESSPVSNAAPEWVWSRSIADAAVFAVAVLRRDRIVEVNPAAVRLTGYSRDELVGMRPLRLVHRPDRRHVPSVAAEPVRLELRITRRDGSTRWIGLGMGPIASEEGTGVVITAVDTTDLHSIEDELARRLANENLLAEISQRFLGATAGELDEELRMTLQRLGEITRADRVTFSRLEPESEAVSVSHEWCAAGVPPLARMLRSVRMADYPWTRARFVDGTVVRFERLDALPAEAAPERRLLERAGVRSALCVPCFSGGRWVGVLTFNTVDRPREWSANATHLLRVAGEIIGSAIERVDSERILRAGRERLELAQRAGHSVIWEWDVLTDEMRLSPFAPEVFRVAADVLPATGAELARMLPADDRLRMEETFRRVFSTGEPYEIEHCLQLPDGEPRWLSVRGQVERADDGRVVRVVGVSADITEAKRAEFALRHEKERAQVTLAAIADGVIRTDASGRIDYLNPAAERLTTWRSEAARGHQVRTVYDVVDEASGMPRPDPVARCLADGRAVVTPTVRQLRRPDGSRSAVREVVTPIRGADGRVAGTVLVFQDLTRVRGLEQEMAYLATHDPLTGLINRREFERRLESALAEADATRRQFALCYLDPDDFKIVNDTCGHAAGDEMLRQLTSVIAAAVSGGDTVARLGGDEFGLLLVDCPVADAIGRSQQVLDAIRHYRFLWQDRAFEVRASIGIVPIEASGGSVSQLLSSADAACYVAKDSGRNQIHLSEPDDAEIAVRYSEMNWVQRIQGALSERRTSLYAQKIVPLSDGNLPEIRELLLRIEEDDGRVIEADHFIGAAERYRLMPGIDQWVVEVGLRRIAELGELDCHWAINLSGQSLTDPEVLRTILDGLAGYELDPSRLLFEITETAAISNLGAAKLMMDALRAVGCRFVLDDFGSGLSSFRYLRALEISHLKVDGELVRHVADDPIQREMVTAIRRIADSMGLLTIGEWVETDEARDTLRDLGVHYAQGFGIHAPEPFL